MTSCSTILFNNQKTWAKKNDGGLFDVTMGSFHGAELCELIGLHLLYDLSMNIGEGNLGLYRDDGLAVIDASSKVSYKRIENVIKTIMDKHDLKITMDIGNYSTNFLDVTFSLKDNLYRPYRKPNSELLYIDNKSNHPQHIKKQLPKMIEERLSSLSSKESDFRDIVGQYNHALKDSGYDYKLSYKVSPNKSAKNRKRNTIYFNPPFCQSVKTKIGKTFLRLVDKHFPKSNEYHKIFNRHTLKISYSCMSNMKTLILSHNKKVLDNFNRKRKMEESANDSMCNCRVKEECPLKGECKVEGIVYQADISSDLGDKIYIGSTGQSFKKRYYGHVRSFNHRNSMVTTLSRFYWENIDNNGKKPEIKWKVLRKIKNAKTNGKLCNICNQERMEIAKANRKKILNRRSEVGVSCPHFKSSFFI